MCTLLYICTLGEVTKKEEEVERGRKELREVSDKMTELQQQLQV